MRVKFRMGSEMARAFSFTKRVDITMGPGWTINKLARAYVYTRTEIFSRASFSTIKRRLVLWSIKMVTSSMGSFQTKLDREKEFSFTSTKTSTRELGSTISDSAMGLWFLVRLANSWSGFGSTMFLQVLIFGICRSYWFKFNYTKKISFCF